MALLIRQLREYSDINQACKSDINATRCISERSSSCKLLHWKLFTCGCGGGSAAGGGGSCVWGVGALLSPRDKFNLWDTQNIKALI